MLNGLEASSTHARVAREERVGGVSVLYLEGPLHWPVAPALPERVEALVASGERAIFLDLARVTGVDAAGIGALVELRARAEAAHGELWVQNAGRVACTLLELAGLIDLLSPVP